MKCKSVRPDLSSTDVETDNNSQSAITHDLSLFKRCTGSIHSSKLFVFTTHFRLILLPAINKTSEHGNFSGNGIGANHRAWDGTTSLIHKLD